MYDALLPIAQDLNTLDATLNAPDSQQRVARIAAAFEQTAQHISSATQSAANDLERIELQKLYCPDASRTSQRTQLDDVRFSGPPVQCQHVSGFRNLQ
jgi:hypothetical protein